MNSLWTQRILGSKLPLKPPDACPQYGPAQVSVFPSVEASSETTGCLPLVMHPTSPEVDLIAWATEHRDDLQRVLLDQGGILFRGFKIHSIPQFESLIKALSGELLDYTYRSPRQQFPQIDPTA